MKILHLVTQDGQPYGSVRKCCERCGLGIHAMPDGHHYIDEKSDFTAEIADQYNFTRCINRHKMDLLSACKLAYRKHHLNDESIGWEELGVCLLDAICNEIGDDGFEAWLNSLKKEAE